MRLIPLKEIAAMEPGEIIPAFKCQVKEIREPKSGTNQYGDWTIQSLTVLDQTAVCQVKLFDCPVYDAAWVGLWLVIESSQNDKGKLVGVEVSEYNKRKEIHVKGKTGAKIEQLTEDAPEPAAPEPAKAPAPLRQAVAPAVRQAQSAPEPAKTAPAPVQSAKTGNPVGDARRKLGQAANGLILAYDAAIWVSTEVMKKHPEITIPLFSPEVIEKLAVHLAISLERSGAAVGLPSGPIRKPEPPKPEPPPEPEDDIPFNFGD